MKKNIITVSLFAALAMSFTACVNEEDDLFDQSAAERLNQSKVTYTERFASSEAGWIMEYYPTNLLVAQHLHLEQVLAVQTTHLIANFF